MTSRVAAQQHTCPPWCVQDHREGLHEGPQSEPLRVPLVDGRTVDLLGECLFTVDGSDGSSAPVGIFVELDHYERGVLSADGARQLAQRLNEHADALRLLADVADGAHA